jgi:hypothetical protein
MKDDTVPVCCGQKTLRDYVGDSVHVGNHEYGSPLHSDSLAVSSLQREEHQRLFPDVPLDSQCRPILSNYKQHDAYIQRRGFEKLPQRKKCRATHVV